MRITLNRLAARLVLILLAPIVLPIKLFQAVTGRGKKPSYASTIEGDPLAHEGDRPVLIAVWAPWASVWRVATEKMVEELKAEFSGKCEFAYVECSHRAVIDAYGAAVVPVLIVRHRGHEVARFPNPLDPEPVRQVIAGCVA